MLSSAHVNRSGRLKTAPPVGEHIGDYAFNDPKQELVKVIRLLALDEEDILCKLPIREGPTRGHARAAECVVRSKTDVAVAFLRSRYWRLRLDN
jgi:hypothetical protein